MIKTTSPEHFSGEAELLESVSVGFHSGQSIDWRGQVATLPAPYLLPHALLSYLRKGR